MPSHRGHAGIFFKLARCGYTLRVTSQTSYSPEYTTPTQKKIKFLYVGDYQEIGLNRFLNRFLFS
jgi:hypothetical protein